MSHLLSLSLIVFVGLSAACEDSNALHDPHRCRMVSTSEFVYNLEVENMLEGFDDTIIMKYDFEMDPKMKNEINEWNGGLDVYLKSAYDYTRWDGPLGIYGPLGPYGPLGAYGAVPNRYKGSVPPNDERTYWNNWCPVPSSENDKECVYGSFGPLGESGPLNLFAYYNTMYHLQENVTWYGDYTINLDAAGVWGVQGPLGALGSLGVLGPVGPLGISLQYGISTTLNGSYTTSDIPPTQGENSVFELRETSPVRYTHNASVYRVYDLFEVYSRLYALEKELDTSFAVDASHALKDAQQSSSSVSVSDLYTFRSKHDQFISINIVPFGDNSSGHELYETFKDLYAQKDYTSARKHKNHWDELRMSVGLVCNGSTIAEASCKISAYNPQHCLMPYITTRLKSNETCTISTSFEAPMNDECCVDCWTGYYLYVTGSGLSVISSDSRNNNPDLWGPRLQSNGQYGFNINGAHQSWSPF